MGRRFRSSPAATWRHARFAVLAIVAFVALNGLVAVWTAAVVAVIAATLSLVDDVVSRPARSAAAPLPPSAGNDRSVAPQQRFGWRALR